MIENIFEKSTFEIVSIHEVTNGIPQLAWGGGLE
jgi:hypothetical protein